MQCLYCGKQLNVLRELTDGEFCSRQHRLRYNRLTQLALKRLTSDSGASSPGARRMPPGGVSTPPVAGFRLPAGGIFRACLPAQIDCRPGSVPSTPFPTRAGSPAPAGATAPALQILNVPALRQGLFIPLPRSREPLAVIRLASGFSAAEPLPAPKLSKASLDKLAVEGVWPAVRPADVVQSHRPCFAFQKLTLEARPPRTPQPVSEGPAWTVSSLVLPQTAGPPPVPAGELRTGGLSGLRTAAVVARQIMGVTAEPLALAPPALVRPTIAPVAHRPAPVPALPAGSMVTGKTIAAKPIASSAMPGLTGNALLPALAPLFRYGQASGAPVPTPKPAPPVAARNRLSKPLAFGPSPFPAPRPVLPPRSALAIVETFQYLRPVEEPVMHWLQNLVQFWGRIPAYARYAAAGASLMLFLWAAFPGTAVADLLGMRLGRIEDTLRNRATVEITEDFSTGMRDWRGQGDWSRSWRIEKAGYVRPGRLALFEPSMKMDNYRVEFLVQIERQAVSWAYRAKDENNYYAAKIRLVRSGPLPLFTLVRYAVVGGEAGPRVEVPIRVMLHNGVPYRVQISANGNDFSTAIEGQLVDFWRDDLFRSGGFGFFADSGERARIYWMRLSQKEDFVGRICAYLLPSALQTRSATRFP